MIVVGVMCSRWHKSVSLRCCLWDKLMCTGSNIGKEWIVYFGICGQHMFHLSEFTVIIDIGVRRWHVESTGWDTNKTSETRIDVNAAQVEDLIYRGWSGALEVASSTVMREWKLLFVNGRKFKSSMPAATGLQKAWQNGTNASMWLGITLENTDTCLNWMNYIWNRNDLSFHRYDLADLTH